MMRHHNLLTALNVCFWISLVTGSIINVAKVTSTNRVHDLFSRLFPATPSVLSEKAVTVKHILARGVQSEVYFGHDSDNHLDFVVKITDLTTPSNWAFSPAVSPTASVPELKLPERELFIHSMVRHPFIAKYYDCGIRGRTGRVFYLFTEYVEGENVDAAIRKCGKGVFDAQTRKRILWQLLEVVQYLHSTGILHRDIKPENIIYNQKEGNIRVIDFGLSRGFNRDKPQRFYTGRGTPIFMAPEVMTVNETGVPYGPQVDYYSVGATAFFLFTGMYPFLGEDQEMKFTSIRDFAKKIQLRLEFPRRANINSDVERIIRGLMEKDSKKRWDYKRCMADPYFAEFRQAAEDLALTVREMNASLKVDEDVTKLLASGPFSRIPRNIQNQKLILKPSSSNEPTNEMGSLTLCGGALDDS